MHVSDAYLPRSMRIPPPSLPTKPGQGWISPGASCGDRGASGSFRDRSSPPVLMRQRAPPLAPLPTKSRTPNDLSAAASNTGGSSRFDSCTDSRLDNRQDSTASSSRFDSAAASPSHVCSSRFDSSVCDGSPSPAPPQRRRRSDIGPATPDPHPSQDSVVRVSRHHFRRSQTAQLRGAMPPCTAPMLILLARTGSGTRCRSEPS
jgi:hypothetical protein